MGKMNAEETLLYIIDYISGNLDELQEILKARVPNPFAHGQATALVECLEEIQRLWEDAEKEGLDYIIEEVYPV